jgi:ubiquinone/menaquinone biosynthesis C-methylase UbiE
MTGAWRIKAAVAGLFDRALAAGYERTDVEFFTILGQRLVKLAAPQPGERVLDVGCGRGACLFPAAQAVGPDGLAVGIDLAPGMVATTAAEARERGLDMVRVQVMDAEEPDFPPDCFDLILAGMVLFFLPDPLAALRRYAVLLAPGGRLAFTSLAGRDPRWDGVEAAVKRFWDRTIEMPSPLGESSPLQDAQGGTALLEQAGFTPTTSVEHPHRTVFSSVEQWYTWSWTQGMRAAWECVAEADRERAKAAVLAELDKLREPDGTLSWTIPIRYTLAHRGCSPSTTNPPLRRS